MLDGSIFGRLTFFARNLNRPKDFASSVLGLLGMQC